jgi:hypothetical protein
MSSASVPSFTIPEESKNSRYHIFLSQRLLIACKTLVLPTKLAVLSHNSLSRLDASPLLFWTNRCFNLEPPSSGVSSHDRPRLVTAENRNAEAPIPVQRTRSAFIRVHNETLTIVPMRVSNPDGSPVGINR